MSRNVFRESGQEAAPGVHSGGGAARVNPSQPGSDKLSGAGPVGYDATGGGSDAPLSADADVDLDALVYVEEVNSNLVCCICQAPFSDPRQFVEHHVREECRYGVSSSSGSPGVRRLEEEIGTPSKNVEETSPLARHYPSCPEVVVPCPHASHGCVWRGRRRDQPGHTAADCPFEPLRPLLQTLTRKFGSLERENRDLRSQLTAVRSELAELRGRAAGAGGGGAPPPAARPSGDYAEYVNRSPPPPPPLPPPPLPTGMLAQAGADLPPEIRRGRHDAILCASLPGYDPEGYFAAAPRAPWCEDRDSLRNQIENLAATVSSLELKHNVTWMQECLRLREEVQALRAVCHNTRSQVNALLLDTRNAAPAAAAAAVPASPAMPVTKIAPANPSLPVVRAGAPDHVGADRNQARLPVPLFPSDLDVTMYIRALARALSVSFEIIFVLTRESWKVRFAAPGNPGFTTAETPASRLRLRDETESMPGALTSPESHDGAASTTSRFSRLSLADSLRALKERHQLEDEWRQMLEAVLEAQEDEGEGVKPVEKDTDADRDRNEQARQEHVERFLREDLSTRRLHGYAEDEGDPKETRNGLLARAMLGAVPNYSGSGGAAAFTNFASKLEAAAEQANLSSQETLALATHHLTGQAEILWQSHTNEHRWGDPHRWTRWEQLREELGRCGVPRRELSSLLFTQDCCKLLGLGGGEKAGKLRVAAAGEES
ncbi:MAG: hypothetical protein BJ554DRAFT_352 [Olpidium bornovanus]|uniref:TRAF-type domain-containing protein n=1 Tax=Olpidium bornovanus TaxID=278681 RepID=A0A8H8DHW8_9FUNG|nr:MAG: hypothetical protein BJ554DRAFT_352 [Olpidium bornovanus]